MPESEASQRALHYYKMKDRQPSARPSRGNFWNQILQRSQHRGSDQLWASNSWKEYKLKCISNILSYISRRLYFPPSPYLGTTYNHELYLLFFLIEEKTEIAPRKAKFTKYEKLICHCFSFKGAVLFQLYSFSLFISQIWKIDKVSKTKDKNTIAKYLFIHSHPYCFDGKYSYKEKTVKHNKFWSNYDIIKCTNFKMLLRKKNNKTKCFLEVIAPPTYT